MPGLYPIAYRATFPAFLCGCLYFVSTACVFLFVFSILSRRCPLLATFLSFLFCLLSLLISDSRFDMVWFRLSCDHGWIRSRSVNVRKTTKQQQQQEEGHTGFFIHLPSAVRALIFLARRIQPFLSLVDREVELCVLRPTLMHTKKLYENGPNPFFSGFFNLMGTGMVQIRMVKSV